MKILITGGGGREHALAVKLVENPEVETIFCAPGNGATALMAKCRNIDEGTPEELASFALREGVELTVPGAEDLLVAGIADTFKKKNLKIFGPHKAAAMLEGSKSFAKDFMKRHGIRTAAYETFTSSEKALSYVETAPLPAVVKADGLAAGKGVIICATREEAVKAVKDIMVNNCFGEAGNSVVIEEFLTGVEASILSVFDGKKITPFISAKDHKKIGEGETGLNTGGMGVIAPNPYVTDKIFNDFRDNIMLPTAAGLIADDLSFSGIIFFGLMINEKGVYLLEYNLRMGDPETQAVLPLLKTDLLEIIDKAMDKGLSEEDLEWSGNCSCAVVQASGGYPLEYAKGYEISGINNDDIVYISGAQLKDGKLLTSGGRVLTVVGMGADAESARTEAYGLIDKIHFTDQYYRKDIGTNL
ncbi:phosphoribosylamine--glycine ligase [Spirochaeta isovalerica]|uniref:Phosphoribosylamine--glycine ligase n=1 Tax=Spirochaeta isovalerica TaxID=150 RepID=A0A841R6G7_9SPIO|nr:phosphoribosylamine--glycine ligase [Spirochaeta isovalerica]MBB6478640.1 phosphoribosylamine--glycine ligase [Spirochaeta isovalerica]